MRLVDTDVFINVSRAAVLRTALHWDGTDTLSDVTYMEFAQGCRNQRELTIWKKICRNFEMLPITQEISTRARFLVDQFGLSHGLTCTDALIAATALTHDCMLLTGNRKHFHFIPRLDITIVHAKRAR